MISNPAYEISQGHPLVMVSTLCSSHATGELLQHYFVISILAHHSLGTKTFHH